MAGGYLRDASGSNRFTQLRSCSFCVTGENISLTRMMNCEQFPMFAKTALA